MTKTRLTDSNTSIVSKQRAQKVQNYKQAN